MSVNQFPKLEQESFRIPCLFKAYVIFYRLPSYIKPINYLTVDICGASYIFCRLRLHNNAHIDS